jgi:predicted HAD superfamily phosphohydrolase YqeG
MADPTITQLVLHHVAPVTFPEPRQQIKGVVFDMDGTLIHEAIDYAAMRAALGIEYPKDVIMEIRAMKDAAKQQEYILMTLMTFSCLAASC